MCISNIHLIKTFSFSLTNILSLFHIYEKKLLFSEMQQLTERALNLIFYGNYKIPSAVSSKSL
jgi:hypothetical protein